MKNYCLYNPAGKIIQYGICPAKDIALQVSGSDQLKELPNNFIEPTFQHYINDNGEYTQCDDYGLSTLPIPCVVMIEGAEYSVTEIPTFTFDAPGAYDLFVSPANAKYKDKVITYEYNA
jgi:hypothetical protein